MNSKERVLTALGHREPDKLPVDCASMRSTGISAKMYSDYCRCEGVSGENVKVYDMVQQLAIPEAWYLKKHKIDTVDLERTFSNVESEWYDFRLHDGTVVKYPGWVKVIKQGTSFFIQNGSGELIADGQPPILYTKIKLENMSYADRRTVCGAGGR